MANPNWMIGDRVFTKFTPSSHCEADWHFFLTNVICFRILETMSSSFLRNLLSQIWLVGPSPRNGGHVQGYDFLESSQNSNLKNSQDSLFDYLSCGYFFVIFGHAIRSRHVFEPVSAPTRGVGLYSRHRDM